ncbi:uncharacterized protein LOC116936169 [Daphnia magna]|uniref:uncharacterized protein LOC116936169 n=1 Tax=Daphnia magna TaxID=35525 RepID=UPI001E1B9F68|nr:uncharacterized protein LOC116936169 [Daphnia magna]
MRARSRFSVSGELEPLYFKNRELERDWTSHERKLVTVAPSINQYSHQVQLVNSKADNRRLTSKSKAMEMASANVSQGMADQITLSASDGSESESESNHANSSVNSSSHVEVENGNTGGKKPTSWNESRIKLPSNYFQFMYDKKDGKGFSVKCLICHKTKTKFNKKDEIELLTITDNSGYNAKRHIR